MSSPVDVTLPAVRQGDDITLVCVQDGTLDTLTITVGLVTKTVTSRAATDQSGATTIKLKVDRPDPTASLDEAHTPVDLVNGAFNFALSGADLVKGSRQRAYVEFDTAGVIDTSSDFFLNVADVIA